MSTNSEPHPVWAFVEHEHRDLASGICRIHEVACGIGRRAIPELSRDLLGILDWVDATLEPHMAWEEAMLYPEVDRRAGTPWATRTARFDHQQIRKAAATLRAAQHDLGHHAGTDSQSEVRCRLISLEALVGAHVEREERFVIPILIDERAVQSSDLLAQRGRGTGLRESRA